MLKNRIDVDILTANFNNGAYIEQLIQSVLESSKHPRKFIIIDDGSTDNSLEVAMRYAQEWDFIKIVALPKNVGFANALNAGIPFLESTYTIRVDPDDYIFPERLEIQYKYMDTNPMVDVLGTNIQYFDSESGKMLFQSNVSLNSLAIKRDFLNASCGIIHGSTIIRTSLLKKYLYIQDNVPAEDYEIFSKMLKAGAVIHNIPNVLTFVRVHINSVSNFLPFCTIDKTYKLANQIWGIKYSRYNIRIKYLHLKYYRLFLFNTNIFKKLYFITISSFCAPDKVIKRFFRS